MEELADGNHVSVWLAHKKFGDLVLDISFYCEALG